MKKLSIILILSLILPIAPVSSSTLESVAVGWSIAENGNIATLEAIDRMRDNLGGDPEYAILFCTVDYEVPLILKEVNKLLPNTKIYGGTSAIGVQTNEGLHIGKKGSLAIMGINSARMSFGVGCADMNKVTPRTAGKKAIRSAIQNARVQEKIPQVVLITAAPGAEEEIIKGVESVIGKDIPIIGGSSADNDVSGKWMQFANKNILSNGVSITAVFTNMKVGHLFEAGFRTSKSKGVITKANGRTIYEIDHRPAAIVYNEWANGLIDKELETGGVVLGKTNLHPLAKIIKKKDGSDYLLSTHPGEVHLPQKALSVFANIKEGDEIQLMSGSWELVLNRAFTTPSQCLKECHIEKDKVFFGIYTFCAGTMLSIPEDEQPRMPLLIKRALGSKVPFIGPFTLGEQGYVPNLGNVHGNLVNSITLFEK
jgi:hypothetical protein